MAFPVTKLGRLASSVGGNAERQRAANQGAAGSITGSTAQRATASIRTRRMISRFGLPGWSSGSSTRPPTATVVMATAITATTATAIMMAETVVDTGMVIAMMTITTMTDTKFAELMKHQTLLRDR
jgi:hypothetical protein